MPLNRPALALSAGPRGVQDARRWVVTACQDLGRSELVECAEMGVSELVTNALLHGTNPIEVRVRGTREHPRIEVHDASQEPPVLPAPTSAALRGLGADGLDGLEVDDLDDDLDGLLLTFGRGLSIVARASDAWGAEIEDDGKTVWFAPAAEFSDDDGPEGVISGLGRTTESTGEQPGDLMEVVLANVPLRDYIGFQRHFRELRREVRLLSLAHEEDYPLAKDLADVFGAISRPLRLEQANPAIASAQESGLATVDLRVVISRAAAAGLDRFLQLLDLTDAFAREEKMLALARTTAQREFESWFLGEFIRQAGGDQPQGWPRRGSAASTSVPRSICS